MLFHTRIDMYLVVLLFRCVFIKLQNVSTEGVLIISSCKYFTLKLKIFQWSFTALAYANTKYYRQEKYGTMFLIVLVS